MQKTFDLETQCKRLPVPGLEDTLQIYLNSLVPLTTPDEFREVTGIVKNFQQTVGPVLQNRLLARDKQEQYSWLDEWWSRYAYMEYRETVLINVSYGITFEDSSLTDPIERAALLASGYLRLKRQLEDQTFPQDKSKNGAPLCMAAYRAVFHSCRIPHETRDYTEYYPFNETNHIVVMLSRNYYVFDSQYTNTNEHLSAADIKEQLLRVVELDRQLSSHPALSVGILACQHRDRWNESRKVLLLDPENKASLDVIQRCAFMIVLDASSPASLTEHSRRLLLGDDGINDRFYDIPLNLVCFKNGKAGVVGEHSRMDGQPVVVVSDLLLEYEREQLKRTDLWTPSNRKLNTPKILNWNLNESILRQQKAALEIVRREIANLDSIVLTSKHGRRTWKNAGCSPDAAVQLALQLCYYTIHKEVTAVYESVSTRTYRRGRTETGRSLTADAKAFIVAALSPDITDLEKYQLFKKAEASHVDYAKKAGQGFGCDRHLLGLKLLIEKDEAVHPLFTHPTYSRSNHWSLSTSTLSPKFITSISFGPVVEDGYGVCYTFRDHDLNVSITNFVSNHVTDCKRFAYLLNKYLGYIETLLVSVKKSLPKEEDKSRAKL